MISNLLLAMGVILLTGLVFAKLSKLCHVPNITGYLLGGLLIGPALYQLFNPNFTGLISSSAVDSLRIITQIELGFIAFSIGGEFKASFLKQVGARPVIMAFAESLGAIILITLGLLAFGYSLPFSLTLGAIGAATAPAATIMVIKQYKARGNLTNTLLSVVAVDDASALIFFGFAITIVKAIEGGTTGMSGLEIFLQVLLPFGEVLASVALGASLGFFLVLFVRFFKGRGNRLCGVLVAVFLGTGLTSVINSALSINISTLLVTMCTGVVFTNMSPFEEEVTPLVDRFTPPFIIMFFVLSGTDLNLTHVATAVLPIIAYVLLRFFGKYLGIFITGKITKAPKQTTNLLSLGLMPLGGVSIGLSMIAMDILQDKEEGMMIRAIILAACFITEFIGPLMTKYMLFKAGEAQLSLK